MPTHLPPPTNLPPNSIVDVYVRDSGGPRQDASTDQQIAEIETYCQHHNLILRNKFIDVARSGGSTIGREAFNQMIDATRRPEDRPHGLLLWNYARFARDLDDAIYYKALLRNRDIIVHSLTDPIPEGQYGRIIEFFVDISNEEKRRQTSADAKRGLRDLVLKHGCVPGIPPKGFKREPVDIGLRRDGSAHVANRWVPDPEYIARIRQAFSMRAEGATLSKIHTQLQLFSAINSYKTFFTNRLYIGILEFGDLVIENYCEPIIEMAIWNAVQARILHHAQAKRDRSHPRRVNTPYILSGLVYCSQCGSPMSANTVSGGQRKRNEAYRCSRSKRKAGCDTPRIGRKTLEDAVLHTLKDYILLPDNLSAMSEIEQRTTLHQEQKHNQRLDDLNAQKKKFSTQIANLTRAIADRGHSQALLDKLNELEASRAQATTEIKQLLAQNYGVIEPLTDPEIHLLIKSFNQMLENASVEQIRLMIQSFVHKINVKKTNGDLTGSITYFVPKLSNMTTDNNPPFDFPPLDREGGSLSIGLTPVGALVQKRHS